VMMCCCSSDSMLSRHGMLKNSGVGPPPIPSLHTDRQRRHQLTVVLNYIAVQQNLYIIRTKVCLCTARGACILDGRPGMRAMNAVLCCCRITRDGGDRRLRLAIAGRRLRNMSPRE